MTINILSFIRHWFAVFGLIYQRRLSTVVDRLCARFKPVIRKFSICFLAFSNHFIHAYLKDITFR